MSLIQNPILPGFNADPSIIRVEDTYYIANSTFEWFPGVRLHESKDLEHWNLLPSPLSTITLLDMRGNSAQVGSGPLIYLMRMVNFGLFIQMLRLSMVLSKI